MFRLRGSIGILSSLQPLPKRTRLTLLIPSCLPRATSFTKPATTVGVHTDPDVNQRPSRNASQRDRTESSHAIQLQTPSATKGPEARAPEMARSSARRNGAQRIGSGLARVN